MCVHDYSENYECSYQEEVQSQNFSRTEASIHVTILCRHASQEFDNCAGTEEQPKIIKEYIFVISDDMAHDSYSVQHVRHIIHNLVNTVGCTVKRLHEFTDGCSAQYKSRHCMGSHVLLSSNDFGYPAQRNYFETSHAKGEQDAAGAHIKQKASLTVVRKEATIQSAEQLCSSLSSSFTEPVSKGSDLKRRVFLYVKKDEVNRKGRKFSEVQGNQKIHCIKPKFNESGIRLVNTRSCYCMSCIDENFYNCQNKTYWDAWNGQQMKVLAEPSTKVTRSEPEPDAERTESLADLASVGIIVAVAAHLDPNYNYYLLQVTTNEPILLQEEQVDDYGCPMPAGS